MPFKQTVQSHDFGANPAANVIFTVPAGHTFARLFSTGLTHATGPLFARTGTGGVIDSVVSDYMQSVIRSQSQGIAGIERGFIFRIDDGNDGKPFSARFYNLNTAAPIVATGIGWDKFLLKPWQPSGIRQSITPYDQIQVINLAGTNITAGVVYLVSYKRTTTVTAVTADAANLTLSGLLKKNGLIVAASYDQTFSSSQDSGEMRVSTGGVIKSGTADYLQNRVGANFADFVENIGALSNSGSTTVPTFGVVGYGFKEEDIHSVVMDDMYLAVGASVFAPVSQMGWFKTVEANDEWTIHSTTIPTGGTVYFTEYQV